MPILNKLPIGGGGASSGTKLNVFAQTNKPESKYGIWIETDKTCDYIGSSPSSSGGSLVIEGYSGSGNAFPATLFTIGDDCKVNILISRESGPSFYYNGSRQSVNIYSFYNNAWNKIAS